MSIAPPGQRDVPPGSAESRLRMALELAETAERIMVQNLRRRHPAASVEELRDLLREWLHHRPGAEHGDGVGRPRRWNASR